MNKRTLAWFGPALLALTAFGCGGGGSGNVPYTPPTPVAVTQPTPPDLSALPTDESGHPVLISTGPGALTIDTTDRGPTQAQAACLAVIGRCWEDQGLTRDTRVTAMDLCERSAPTCATAEPWNEAACCPASCWDRYEQGRLAGQDPNTIEEEIYFGADPCIPGLGELLHPAGTP